MSREVEVQESARPSQAFASAMRPSDIVEHLNTLRDLGMIKGWRRYGRASGRRWEIETMDCTYGPFFHAQVSAWVEGAHAIVKAARS